MIMSRLLLISLLGLIGTGFAADMASPPNALVVDEQGGVGIGTATPNSPIHVVRSDGTAKVLVEETQTATANRILLHLKNNGPITQWYTNTFTGSTWGMNSLNGGFVISKGGSGFNEFFIANNGDIQVPQGTVIHGSSRSYKRDIQPVNAARILEKVAGLPIATWRYDRSSDRDALPSLHLGPMAEDFHAAFGLGGDDKSIGMGDVSGVALAAIQGLKNEMEGKFSRLQERLMAKEAKIATLEQRNAGLLARLERLEELLFDQPIAAAR